MKFSTFSLRSCFVAVFFIAQTHTPALAQIGKDTWSITIDATLASGLSSKLYKNYLNGLVNTQPKVQYKFSDKWFAAMGAKYAYYTVSEFKTPVKMTGGLHSYGGYIEAGYQEWRTAYFGIEASLKVGYNEHQFITSVTRSSGVQKVQAMYYTPTFSLILAADEATAYRWVVGYNIDAYNFKTYHIGIPSDAGYSAKESRGPAQSLLVGFAFSYYFGNKRSDADLE